MKQALLMISAMILTKNEEKNIVDCLESLSFCDEIVVVDDNSEDRTLEIAKKMGAKIFIHPLNNNFSQQRNFALSLAKNNWVLFIDADERVTPQLGEEIVNFVKNSNNNVGAYVKRQDVMWGKELKYGETGTKRFLRLAKKNAGRWVGSVHEEWIVQGDTISLDNSLTHYPHQSVAQFLKEINYYTDIRAAELFEKKVRVKWYSVIVNPTVKFFQDYFFKLGFMDGLPGFIVSMLMSFHSFLVRGKLWLLWQKK